MSYFSTIMLNRNVLVVKFVAKVHFTEHANGSVSLKMVYNWRSPYDLPIFLL